jgi:Tfp pilus assembly protein PilV
VQIKLKTNFGFTRTLKKKNISLVCGFTLVEILVACGIISVTLLSLIASAQKGIELSTQALRQVQASYLLEEGAEATKSIRDANWTNISGLTLGSTYYLSYNTGTNIWSLSATPNTVDSFTRIVVITAVSRDGSDDITTSGGTVDTGTKKVTVSVSWPSVSGTLTKTLSFYIANIFN